MADAPGRRRLWGAGQASDRGRAGDRARLGVLPGRPGGDNVRLSFSLVDEPAIDDGIAPARGAPVTDPDSYFAANESAQRDEGGTYVAWEEITPIEMVPGLEIRPLLGESLMVTFVRFEPHTEAPRHWHDEEQMTIVLEGELEFEVGDETRTVRPGEAIVILPNVPHAARTHDGTCLEMDVFHPPRQGLLEAMRRADPA